MSTQSEDIHSEQRESARSGLMMRLAKVVCQTGEYPCLLRDVSDGGAGLAFLHDVPPEDRIILQLASGLTFPIERAWSKGRKAGYRLACSPTREDFLRNRGEDADPALNLAIAASARIIDGREIAEVQLKGLSTASALVGTSRHYDAGRTVSLALPGYTPWLAESLGQNEDALRLRFVEPVTLGELAAIALHLQPFSRVAGPVPREADTRVA